MGRRWLLLVPLVPMTVVACGGDDAASGPTVATTVTSSVALDGTAPSVGSAPPTVTSPGTATTSPVATFPPTTIPTGAVVPAGFAAEAGRISAADGTVCDVCLWVAATAAERAQGLMGVTDLGGADGMVFLWDEPTTSQFWMRDTPMPLSIAFFADGEFVSSADMVPCMTGPAEGCPRYTAAAPYVAAIEVFPGGLEAIAVRDGSRLELLDLPCDPVAPAGSA
ncbi:MAG: DUF192 domain-containing protein [Ilumatobacteraceae bacterium]